MPVTIVAVVGAPVGQYPTVSPFFGGVCALSLVTCDDVDDVGPVLLGRLRLHDPRGWEGKAVGTSKGGPHRARVDHLAQLGYTSTNHGPSGFVKQGSERRKLALSSV